jgi:hypothetical protein
MVGGPLLDPDIYEPVFEREEVRAIPGIGETALHICEEALGRLFPSPARYWQDRGIPKHGIEILLREGIEKQEQLLELTREEVLRLQGMTPALLGQIEKTLAGGYKPDQVRKIF